MYEQINDCMRNLNRRSLTHGITQIISPATHCPHSSDFCTDQWIVFLSGNANHFNVIVLNVASLTMHIENFNAGELEGKLWYVKRFYKYIKAVYMDETIDVFYDKIVQRVFFKKITYLNFDFDTENLIETKTVVTYFKHLKIPGITNWQNSLIVRNICLMKCIINDFVVYTEMLKYASVDRIRYHDEFVKDVNLGFLRPHFKDAKYLHRVRASHWDLSPSKLEN